MPTPTPPRRHALMQFFSRAQNTGFLCVEVTVRCGQDPGRATLRHSPSPSLNICRAPTACRALFWQMSPALQGSSFSWGQAAVTQWLNHNRDPSGE